MPLRRVLLPSLSLLSAALPLSAVEWTWTWKPAPGDKAPTATICPLKYGKSWAYAVELDDGPKWIRTFAVPFFAAYTYTDAPPGVAGGTKRPFVGGAAVIVAALGSNDATLNWEDLAALRTAGWGVLNHSMTHTGRSWGDDDGKLTDQQVADDAWWGQAILANGLGGRAPTAAVYANGYTDYNRDGALEKVGIRIATRVSGSSPNNLAGDVKWMDYNRNYLDEGAWTSEWSKGDPLIGIPGIEAGGPSANTFFIDFTHGIEQQADTPNQQRWVKRLSTIAERWGAAGSDALWCAPTGEVSDYAHAAAAAKVTVTPGKLTVTLPDDLPGSALTVRLSGIGEAAKLVAPVGGTLYRKGNEVWVTSPLIGLEGAAAPHLTAVYDGPAGDIDLKGAQAVAGISIRMSGEVPAGFASPITLVTATGDKVLPTTAKPPHAGWFSGSLLNPIMPAAPAITATRVKVTAQEPIKSIVVWAISTAGAAAPAGSKKKIADKPEKKKK